MNKLEPLQPGVLRLGKLKTEGRLSTGDTVETLKLGACVVVSIPATHTLTVKDMAGKYHTISGLFFPGARLESASRDVMTEGA